MAGFAIVLAAAARVTRVVSFAAAFAMLGLLTPPAAFAQSTPPPPVRTMIDANGVDLFTGALAFSSPSVSIGEIGAGGLAYVREYDSSVQAWRDNLDGGIDSAGTAYTVTLMGQSSVFTLSGSVFTANEPDGSTLTFNSGTNRYTFTTRTGAVAIYDKALAGTQPTQANEGRVTSLTAPSGEILTFTYATLTAGVAQRLQSLTNNLGYQLHFDYLSNDPAAGGMTLSGVIAINNAVDYCDPAADDCAGLTQSWPSLSFGYGAGSRAPAFRPAAAIRASATSRRAPPTSAGASPTTTTMGATAAC